MTIELPYKYHPRDYQVKAWRAMDEYSRVVTVWHRRAGKDKLAFNKLICKAAERAANYAYYFPTAALGKKALWLNVDVTNGMRVIDHVPQALLAKPPNQTEMRIELVNGSTIQVLGTDNLDVVGGNFYGTVWSEQSIQNPMAWDLTRPILAENKGFAWFNGTPRGKNHFYRMLNMARTNERWFSEVLTVEDTGAISAEDIQAEREAGMSEDMIRQEFYCDFNAANPGAIYANLVEKARTEGRIASFPVADTLVHTTLDIGSPANSSVWYWQIIGAEIRVIDCDIGIPFETLTARVSHMMAKGYNYGYHFLPHDAKQTQFTGKTNETELINAGLKNVRVLPRTIDVWMGINGLKGLFPAMAFRTPQCEKGLEALEAYHTKEVELGRIISNQPVHDWSSHTCDALRYMAEAVQCGAVKVGATMHRRTLDDEDDRPRRRNQAKFGFVGR